MGTCPSSVVCPSDDGCTYFSFFQGLTRLQVNCATDFYGGDYKLGRVSSTVHARAASRLTTTDRNAGILHASLCARTAVHRRHLRGAQLLPQERIYDCATQVGMRISCGATVPPRLTRTAQML
jgi:hypothetical protein